ncbi:acid sphingomyelinase-like phosphodiesterase 3b [Engraulis encrasicolus]|uniref:acid sphingomyelinase-like phosphodiesterase 3b n=1 Tax=Engraulis encrasicolus TaxID=184585 RepID=UPI002FD404E0
MNLTAPVWTCLIWIVFVLISGGDALTGSFWHVSDLHWDPSYKLGDDPTAVCASSGSRPAQGAGRFGDYLCDSPWDLINSSMFAMKSILPDPDFILWTGDDTPHVPDADLGEEKVVSIMANLTDLINIVFPNTKVYPAIGNHDYHPKSQLPAGENYIYNQTAEMWKQWLEPDSYTLFRTGGYYTEKLLNRPGYRIMVLNTNLYYVMNKATESMTDPADQFAWMDEILTDAANQKEKVYIVAHIPPGYFEKKRGYMWFRPNFNLRYLELTRKHHAVIMGQFFGHHHTDCFRMVYNAEGSPVSTLFLTPGVTPWKTTLPGVVDGANNPGIRIFEYDTDSLQIQDMVTYYLNLTYANMARARWEKEYRLTETFRVPDGSPASMHRILVRMEQESCVLQKYYELNSVSYDLSTCDADCRLDHVCSTREIDQAAYEECVSGVAAVVPTSGLAVTLLSALAAVFNTAWLRL